MTITHNVSDWLSCTRYIPIAYNFPLNTRKGFRTIYLLMKLSNGSFAKTVTDIIRVRHQSVDNAIKTLSSIEAENQDILKALTDAYYVYP